MPLLTILLILTCAEQRFAAILPSSAWWLGGLVVLESWIVCIMEIFFHSSLLPAAPMAPSVDIQFTM